MPSFCARFTPLILFLSIFYYACKESPKMETKPTQIVDTPLQISLAQWSLNKALFAGEIDPFDFPTIAKNDLGINAVEYVNQFYVDYAEDSSYWHRLKNKTDSAGVQNLLIMVDDEGDLGDPDPNRRARAVQNHHKWIMAAKWLGCHSIRVNAFGDGPSEVIKESLTDGLRSLCQFAEKQGINVLIENHGLYSSDASWVVQVIQAVNRPNLGTLPDFGNWCLSAKWGSTRLGDCVEVYDRYQGLQEFLPYAKGVSAKSYDFNSEGGQDIIDYAKMIDILKSANYQGFIGIEYEGENLSEREGIIATKSLLEKLWQAATK